MKKIYIDGNVLVTRGGRFYAKDFCVFSNASNFDEVVRCKTGLLKIQKNYGSIFDEYYIKGDLAVTDGECIAFKDKLDYYYKIYQDKILCIKRLLEINNLSSDEYNLLMQQQYISAIGSLEYLLYIIIMKSVSNDKSLYNVVVNFMLPKVEQNTSLTKLLKGIDCLDKEISVIRYVDNIVYHRIDIVSDLYEKLFKVNLNLKNLSGHITMRHDLVHRIGYKTNGEKIILRKEDVYELIKEIDSVAKDINSHIIRKNING